MAILLELFNEISFVSEVQLIQLKDFFDFQFKALEAGIILLIMNLKNIICV